MIKKSLFFLVWQFNQDHQQQVRTKVARVDITNNSAVHFYYSKLPHESRDDRRRRDRVRTISTQTSQLVSKVFGQ